MDNVASRASEDALMRYWETEGKNWDRNMAQQHAETLRVLSLAARLDQVATEVGSQYGFLPDTTTNMSRSFELADGKSVLVRIINYEARGDGSIELEFNDGTACRYRNKLMGDDDPYFTWSGGKAESLGSEGEDERHIYGFSGFMIENNKTSVDTALSAIRSQVLGIY